VSATKSRDPRERVETGGIDQDPSNVIRPDDMGFGRMNACAGRLCINLSLLTAAAAIGCKEPRPAPEDFAKAAESARAAQAASSAASAAPAVEEAPPVVSEQPFKAEPPSSVCAPAHSEPCSLDAIAGATATDLTTVKRESPTMLVGWAVDWATSTVPPVVIIELAGAKKKFYAPAVRATKRPDVATATKSPAYVRSGWDVLGVLKDVDPGEYAVHVIQVNTMGMALSCDTRRKLKVE
jgi:hypothetical protein